MYLGRGIYLVCDGNVKEEPDCICFSAYMATCPGAFEPLLCKLVLGSVWFHSHCLLCSMYCLKHSSVLIGHWLAGEDSQLPKLFSFIVLALSHEF